ncbi:hypothetical protein INT46_000696 [Mucor plumbeus]|uniref:Uncharacterized protein n=1 Tax=Mucor plumbeus TaxID=97098 RepID=A0A8H7QSA9_9FUNG|nr:hypothetical protein INT46_000696 [Mucor plumbeus]
MHFNILSLFSISAIFVSTFSVYGVDVTGATDTATGAVANVTECLNIDKAGNIVHCVTGEAVSSDKTLPLKRSLKLSRRRLLKRHGSSKKANQELEPDVNSDSTKQDEAELYSSTFDDSAIYAALEDGTFVNSVFTDDDKATSAAVNESDNSSAFTVDEAELDPLTASETSTNTAETAEAELNPLTASETSANIAEIAEAELNPLTASEASTDTTETAEAELNPLIANETNTDTAETVDSNLEFDATEDEVNPESGESNITSVVTDTVAELTSFNDDEENEDEDGDEDEDEDEDDEDDEEDEEEEDEDEEDEDEDEDEDDENELGGNYAEATDAY